MRGRVLRVLFLIFSHTAFKLICFLLTICLFESLPYKPWLCYRLMKTVKLYKCVYYHCLYRLYICTCACVHNCTHLRTHQYGGGGINACTCADKQKTVCIADRSISLVLIWEQNILNILLFDLHYTDITLLFLLMICFINGSYFSGNNGLLQQ